MSAVDWWNEKYTVEEKVDFSDMEAYAQYYNTMQQPSIDWGKLKEEYELQCQSLIKFDTIQWFKSHIPQSVGDGWVSVGDEPKHLSTIIATNGVLYVMGGYYREAGKICVVDILGKCTCLSLEENFTHYKYVSL